MSITRGIQLSRFRKGVLGHACRLAASLGLGALLGGPTFTTMHGVALLYAVCMMVPPVIVVVALLKKQPTMKTFLGFVYCVMYIAGFGLGGWFFNWLWPSII